MKKAIPDCTLVTSCFDLSKYNSGCLDLASITDKIRPVLGNLVGPTAGSGEVAKFTGKTSCSNTISSLIESSRVGTVSSVSPKSRMFLAAKINF